MIAKAVVVGAAFLSGGMVGVLGFAVLAVGRTSRRVSLVFRRDELGRLHLRDAMLRGSGEPVRFGKWEHRKEDERDRVLLTFDVSSWEVEG